MNNTIRNVITIGAVLIAFACAAGDTTNNGYNAYISSGVQNNVVRYGIKEANAAIAANAGVTVNGLKYVDSYDLSAGVAAPTGDNQHALTVISTGVKKNLIGDFTGRVGVEYAVRPTLKDDLNSNFKLAYEKFSLVKPYASYGYDYNRKLHIAEAGLPIEYIFKNVPVVNTVTANVVAAYNYYQGDLNGVYQTAKFGGGLDIPVWGPINLFAQGTYYRALENSKVAFNEDWVGVVGLKLKF